MLLENESLAGSRAVLAVDLRRQIREQITQGKSDDEILAYMTARYGDFVRYRPPLKGTTVALWLGPFMLLIVAAGGLAQYLRRRRARIEPAVLSTEEEARVARLLDRSGQRAMTGFAIGAFALSVALTLAFILAAAHARAAARWR